MTRHLALVALLALFVVGAATAPARLWADHGGPVVVPDVSGRTPDEARQALEAVSLAPVLVAVAGPRPGRVERQEPPAGARVAVGSEVVVRYGIALRLETRVPELRGRLLPEIGPELEGAYTLEVELVFSPGAADGTILEQQPAAGQTLWYRGVLLLKVAAVRPPGSGTAVVPAVVGRMESEALEQLKSLGLLATIDYRPEATQPPGTVLSQDPRSGVEMLVGGTVFLRVAGNPPQDPPAHSAIPVPALIGMDMNVALSAVQAQGFVPQLAFKVGGGYAPWSVMGQDPAPATPRPAGSPVTLVISLPAQAPQQVVLPSFFGMPQPQAVQTLAALGLGAQVELKAVGFPAGRVFSQQPAPGAMVPKGASVLLSVAHGVPGPGNPVLGQVPHVISLSGLEAWKKIQAAGFTPKALQHVAPNQPVEVVDAQQPAAGAVLPTGSEVRFYVPTPSIVPTLFGRTRTQAIQLLQAEGFNADPQGPAFGLGSTVVIAQGAPAGVPLARGSTVAFAYKFEQGGGMPAKVHVPDLGGKTREDAVAELQQKWLGVSLQHQGPILPGPGTKVVGQNPAPGTKVPPGTVVTVVYVDVGGPQVLAQVPALVGKTLGQAQQLLAAANLGMNATLQGPNLPAAVKVVSAQQPAPGALVAQGTVVQVTYVEQPLQLQLVTVPQLTGLTKAEATTKVQGLGLVAKFNGPGGNPHKLRVILQAPAQGTKLAPGSQVTMVVIQLP